jgi:putative phosphoribosyl transferase
MTTQVIEINSNISIDSILSIPENSKSLVIFAHGSGSGLTSSRNQKVAQILNDNGFGTLLLDLLTKSEQESDVNAQNIVGKVPGVILLKFNIELLTERLDAVTQWVQSNNNTKNLKFAYFGASTGAAAAIYSAASFKDIKAVVCRGGRTDMVDKKTLSDVRCPCLFIVGSDDKKVIGFNKNTFNQLVNVKYKKLEIVKGASHLFEEEGKIELVANLASEWFAKYLR